MESQIIEYKETWRDEYLKWICGFANAQGGTIFIGINDRGRGIWRVDKAFSEARLELPTFEESCGGVTVRIPRPKMKAPPKVTPQPTPQVTPQPTHQVKTLVFSLKQQRLTIEEIMAILKLKDKKYFRTSYLRPAIESGWVVPLYPDKPNHPDQRYYLIEAGLKILTNETVSRCLKI